MNFGTYVLALEVVVEVTVLSCLLFIYVFLLFVYLFVHFILFYFICKFLLLMIM